MSKAVPTGGQDLISEPSGDTGQTNKKLMEEMGEEAEDTEGEHGKKVFKARSHLLLH